MPFYSLHDVSDFSFVWPCQLEFTFKLLDSQGYLAVYNNNLLTKSQYSFSYDLSLPVYWGYEGTVPQG